MGLDTSIGQQYLKCFNLKRKSFLLTVVFNFFHVFFCQTGGTFSDFFFSGIQKKTRG